MRRWPTALGWVLSSLHAVASPFPKCAVPRIIRSERDAEPLRCKAPDEILEVSADLLGRPRGDTGIDHDVLYPTEFPPNALADQLDPGAEAWV